MSESRKSLMRERLTQGTLGITKLRTTTCEEEEVACAYLTTARS